MSKVTWKMIDEGTHIDVFGNPVDRVKAAMVVEINVPHARVLAEWDPGGYINEILDRAVQEAFLTQAHRIAEEGVEELAREDGDI